MIIRSFQNQESIYTEIVLYVRTFMDFFFLQEIMKATLNLGANISNLMTIMTRCSHAV